MARQKHIPLRTCVSCGTKAAKRELLRIVASKDGDVQLDPSGKADGRGAYVCRGGDCRERGLIRGRVQHALRLELDGQQWDELTRSLEGALSAPG
jgi:predicted RNA-binding protein YlxR (DUF448 family)